ncbi:MAG: hypothetical protein SFT81_08030 [Candidatus Caenarcaniphilales bacterium]|nr:hypothetical protein [Candidatus Caenarcaniphilales bacterium]
MLNKNLFSNLTLILVSTLCLITPLNAEEEKTPSPTPPAQNIQLLEDQIRELRSRINQLENQINKIQTQININAPIGIGGNAGRIGRGFGLGGGVSQCHSNICGCSTSCPVGQAAICERPAFDNPSFCTSNSCRCGR